jgi:DNA-binding IclR family transcriptional regulator
MTARRQIFVVLRDAARPLTVAEIVLATGLGLGTVANVCSGMEQTGLARRPLGARQGYELAVDILPEDQALLARLVATYGAARLRKELGE